MVQERLDQYRVTSRKLPRRIIFFRDGVSEGQFYTVIQEELPKIKDACARMVAGGGYRPKITVVRVESRSESAAFANSLL